MATRDGVPDTPGMTNTSANANSQRPVGYGAVAYVYEGGRVTGRSPNTEILLAHAASVGVLHVVLCRTARGGGRVLLGFKDGGFSQIGFPTWEALVSWCLGSSPLYGAPCSIVGFGPPSKSVTGHLPQALTLSVRDKAH